MPVDFEQTCPLRLQDGVYRESFEIAAHRAGGGAWVVAMFAELPTNEMKVGGMLDVVLEPF